jgi:hypothetical protein
MIQGDKLQSPSGGQENTTLSKGCIIHFRIVAEMGGPDPRRCGRER